MERRSGNGYNVRIVLEEYDNFLNQTVEHMHPQNPENTEAQRIRSHRKRDARNSDVKQTTIAANVAGANEVVLAKIGKIGSVRSDVRRQHAAIMEYPPIPDDTVFEIPAAFNVSSTGEEFIHYDNGREDCIIIFGTRESLAFLQNSEICMEHFPPFPRSFSNCKLASSWQKCCWRFLSIDKYTPRNVRRNVNADISLRSKQTHTVY